MLKLIIYTETFISDYVLELIRDAYLRSVDIEVHNIHLGSEVELCFNSVRNQVNASKLLDLLTMKFVEKDEYVKYVFVVNVDAYVPGLNYVLGVARMCGNHAIVFTPRLRQEFWGLPSNEQLFYERLAKEIIHEVGHTLCFEHCITPTCVMRFSNSVFETDEKSHRFCSKCETRLIKILKTIHKSWV